MDFRVLGPLEAVGEDGTSMTPGAAKQRRLLAALLLEPRRTVSIDRLIEIIWEGEALPESPVPAVRTYVARLRASLDGDGGQPRITGSPTGYVLQVDDHDIDANRFAASVQRTRGRLEEGDAEGALAIVDAALGAWRGAAYAELADSEWFRPEAVRLEELRLEAMELRGQALLAAGRDADAAADGERFTRAQPLREVPHRQLMTALARLGRQAEALAVGRSYRRRLAEETGLDPSARLASLEAAILAGEHAPATTAPSAKAEAHATPRSNLASPRTTFVGRQTDIAEISRRLRDTRLVTLTGIGGAGKTRLAIEAGHAVLEQFSDGVFMAELASLQDPTLVGQRIGDAVGMPAMGTATATPESGDDRAVAAVARFLGDRELLLILDNCEHMLDACARVVDHLLDACPHLAVLATSREDLGVDGELIWGVGSLTLPGESGGGEAMELLIDRARLIDPSFELDDGNREALAVICHRLDGIPLAIELASGRLSHLSPREVADRLEDRFELLVGSRHRPSRQQTLGAAIDWSHNLLDDDEATLFRRLSVFGGGATLAAVEAVCGMGRAAVVDLLGSLVAKSLVVADTKHGGTRYRMLETVRMYALDKLDAAGEVAEVRNRHRRWLAERFEEYPWDLRLASPKVAAVLETERDNLRHILEWSLTDAGDTASTARLLMGASGLFITFGDLSEGRRWHAALGPALAGLDADLRDRLAIHRALIECWRSGGGLMSLFDELLDRVPKVMASLPADCPEMAIGHAVMAVVHAIVTHDPEQMVHHGRAAAEVAMRLDAPHFAGFATTLAAGGHLYRGDAASAVAELEPMVTMPGWHEEHDGLRVRAHLAIARHLAGDHRGALADAGMAAPRLSPAWRHDPLIAQALAHAALGDIPAAEDCMREALRLHNELRWNEPITRHDMLIGFGGIAALRGDHRRASAVLGPVQWTTNPSAFGVYLHYRNLVREQLDAGTRHECMAEGRARGVDEMLRQEAAAVGMQVKA